MPINNLESSAEDICYLSDIIGDDMLYNIHKAKEGTCLEINNIIFLIQHDEFFILPDDIMLHGEIIRQIKKSIS